MFFVNVDHQLRGCIGQITPLTSIAVSIVRSSVLAGLGDPRFLPLQLSDITPGQSLHPPLEVTVSILSSPRAITNALADIQLGVHGVMITSGLRHGVFLPEVAVEEGWDTETTMAMLVCKVVVVVLSTTHKKIL